MSNADYADHRTTSHHYNEYKDIAIITMVDMGIGFNH